MGITRGTVRSAATAGSSTSFTITSVDCTGSDRYLEVGIAVAINTVSVSSVVFNGSENLTQIDVATVSATNPTRLETWALVAPSSTSASVVVTLSSSNLACGQAIPRFGVDQTTPRNAGIKATTNSGTTLTLTGTITCDGGDDILSIWASHDPSNRTWTVDAGVTEILNNQSGTGASHCRLISIEDTDTETDKVLGTVSSNSGLCCMGWNLNAASAGGYTLTAANGSFTESGQSANLLAGRVVPITSGAFTESGQGVALLAERRAVISNGTFALTGKDVSLAYTPAGSYTLPVSNAAFTLSGQATALRATRTLPVTRGSFALTGQGANLLRGRTLTAAAGVYTISGQAAALRAARALAIASGSFTLSGQLVTLTYSGVGAPYVGMIRLTAARGPACAFYAGPGPAVRLTSREPLP